MENNKLDSLLADLLGQMKRQANKINLLGFAAAFWMGTLTTLEVEDRVHPPSNPQQTEYVEMLKLVTDEAKAWKREHEDEGGHTHNEPGEAFLPGLKDKGGIVTPAPTSPPK